MLNKLVCFEGLVNFGSIEANNNRATYIKHRYAHLAGLLDCFFGMLRVVLYVFVDVLDPFALKVIFGGVTESTPCC
jgi:hypothetical protein